MLINNRYSVKAEHLSIKSTFVPIRDCSQFSIVQGDYSAGRTLTLLQFQEIPFKQSFEWDTLAYLRFHNQDRVQHSHLHTLAVKGCILTSLAPYFSGNWIRVNNLPIYPSRRFNKCICELCCSYYGYYAGVTGNRRPSGLPRIDLSPGSLRCGNKVSTYSNDTHLRRSIQAAREFSDSLSLNDAKPKSFSDFRPVSIHNGQRLYRPPILKEDICRGHMTFSFYKGVFKGFTKGICFKVDHVHWIHRAKLKKQINKLTPKVLL
jgi:hypothetical protein